MVQELFLNGSINAINGHGGLPFSIYLILLARYIGLIFLIDVYFVSLARGGSTVGKWMCILLVVACDECYALGIKVWSQSPYKEPQTVVQEIEKPTITEWRALCGQLESALRDVQSQTLFLNTAAGDFCSEIEGVFNNSAAGMREVHLPVFRKRSSEYADLLDEMVYELKQAERAACEVTRWPFDSLESVAGSVLPTGPPPAESRQLTQPPEGWTPPEWLPRQFFCHSASFTY